MTLHLYFARRFLWVFAAVTVIFLLILFLLDMIEQLRVFGPRDVSFGEVVKLTLLNVPTGLYRILPLIVILSTITLFLSLARSSELVVTRAAGRSAMRALIAPVVAVFLIGVVSVAAFNPIVAATAKQYDVLSTRYKLGVESVLSISQEGLWLREGTAEGQTVIRAVRSNQDGTHLFNVTFIHFQKDQGPDTRVEADEAILTPGAWTLLNAKEWKLADSTNPERDAISHASLAIPSSLTSDQIADSFGTPSGIPIWELPAFIQRLDKAGFSARQYRVWLQMELAMPLMLVAMLLIGAGFTMRHTRLGRTDLMILGALLFGIGLYFLRNFVQILGESGQLPIYIAAWAPPVAAICLTLALLLHLEDG